MTDARLLFVIPAYFDIDDHIGSTRASPLPPFTIPYGVLSLEAYVRHSCRFGARRPVPLRVLLEPFPPRSRRQAHERPAGRCRGSPDEGTVRDDGATIEDDHFFHDKNRAKQILRALTAFDIRIEFPNGVAVYALDEEVAQLFSTAGVSTVALAVESGSDYVLNKIIKKPLKTKMIRSRVQVLRNHGIQSHVFIVIGLPGEMPEHRPETLNLLLDAGFDWVHVFCATSIVGSRLYDICVENDYIINTTANDHVNTKSVIRAPGVDPKEIEKTAYDMNLSVNFANNWNMRNGRYDTAIRYFRNVVDKYPDHAFGHYFLARAYEDHGNNEAPAKRARDRFDAIVDNDPWWRSHALRYG